MKINDPYTRGSRLCCYPVDLHPILNTPLVKDIPEYVYCIHCGRHRKLLFADPVVENRRYAELPAPWLPWQLDKQ